MDSKPSVVMLNCIDQLRREKRIPVKDFLDDLKIPRTTYYRFVNNSAQPSYELVERIAEYLQVPVEELCSTEEVRSDKADKNGNKANNNKNQESLMKDSQLILASHKLFLAYKKKYGKEKASAKRRELMTYYLEDKFDLMFSDILLMSIELDVMVSFLEHPSKEQYFKFANRFI